MFAVFICTIMMVLSSATPSYAKSSKSKVIHNVKFHEITNDLLARIERPMSKSVDADVWSALNSLNSTLWRFNEFQSQVDHPESRDAMAQTRLGVLIFTRYCGPGSRLLNKIFKTDERTYSSIDVCCQMHDDCPHYVSAPPDYGQYPGLELRPQFFSRLQCSCDADFYQCLQGIDTPYAYAVGIGYSLFQRFCFEYEHPVLNCTEYYTGFGLRRCTTYNIDEGAEKTWQWFDVLPPYLEIYNFPQLIQSTLSFRN